MQQITPGAKYAGRLLSQPQPCGLAQAAESGTARGCGHLPEGLTVPDSTPDSAAVIALRQRPANPVIEQAKNIVMTELTCTPDEAFDLLRRASQRVNIKVSVLAAHLIDQAPGWSQLGV